MFQLFDLKNDSVNLRSPSPDVDGVSNSSYMYGNFRTDGQPKVDRSLPSIDDLAGVSPPERKRKKYKKFLEK